MIPNYVQIDMVIVSINTGNHTISLNKHTIGLEIYNSTRQYTFRPMCHVGFNLFSRVFRHYDLIVKISVNLAQAFFFDVAKITQGFLRRNNSSFQHIFGE